MRTLFGMLLVLAIALPLQGEDKLNVPPEGFKALFNGKNLDGWIGRGTFDPRKWEAMSPDEQAQKLKADNESLHQHWRVEDGLLINDGKGKYATTKEKFGDFILLVDWKMVAPNGDSGIYLRGVPQVQIWDPDNPAQHKHGNQKGSGGLWNNNPGSEGKDPLVKADAPIGEWNTFRIKMVGDRVTVHLNDKLVVDNAVMHNYFDRKNPIFDTGVIQLQTHGSEMHFRNVFIKELPRSESE